MIISNKRLCGTLCRCASRAHSLIVEAVEKHPIWIKSVTNNQLRWINNDAL